MRLSELYTELQSYSEKLKFVAEKKASVSTSTSTKMTNPNNYLIKNMVEVNSTLYKLNKYSIFQEDIKRISSQENYLDIFAETVLIPENIYRLYISVFVSIKAKISVIEFIYNETAPKFESNTLCFSFPDEEQELLDLKVFSKNIITSLNQISNIPNFKGTVTFKGVESGSEWFYFSISGQELIEAFTILIPLIKACIIEAIETFKAYKRMKAINLLEESNVQLTDIMQTLIRNSIANEKYFNNLSAEDQQRLIASAIMISDQIQKGSMVQFKLLNQLNQPTDSQIDKQLKSSIDEIKLLNESPSTEPISDDSPSEENGSSDND